MGILDDDLDDPTPTPVVAEQPRPNLKRRLPLKADIEVDRKKYKGERVSRADADIAQVVDYGVIVNDSGDNEDMEESSSDGEDFGVAALIAENNAGDLEEEASDADALENADDDSDEEMRQQEIAIKERLAGEKDRELRRAAAVKEQKAVHDSVVDVRIRLEKVMNVARSFPLAVDRAGQREFDKQSADIRDATERLEKLADSFTKAACAVALETADDTAYTLWRDSVLDKWGRRVSEAEGLTPKGGFKVIDTSISGQLRAALESGKHVRKSRRVRAQVELIDGVSVLKEGDNELQFDDCDLYRSLLQEIIESGDGDGGALRHAQLAKTGKVKKKIDRSGSKGRKLRYVVHEKLVGFLAPVPLPDPGPVDEILAALFGKR